MLQNKKINVSDMRNLLVSEMDVSAFAYPYIRSAGMEQHGFTKREFIAIQAMKTMLFDSENLSELIRLEGIKKGFDYTEDEIESRIHGLISKRAFKMASHMLKECDID